MVADPAGLPAPGKFVAVGLLNPFLTHAKRHNEWATYLRYKHFLRSFSDRYARPPAADLKLIHITRRLDVHPRLGRRP